MKVQSQLQQPNPAYQVAIRRPMVSRPSARHPRSLSRTGPSATSAGSHAEHARGMLIGRKRVWCAAVARDCHAARRREVAIEAGLRQQRGVTRGA